MCNPVDIGGNRRHYENYRGTPRRSVSHSVAPLARFLAGSLVGLLIVGIAGAVYWVRKPPDAQPLGEVWLLAGIAALLVALCGLLAMVFGTRGLKLLFEIAEGFRE